MPQRDASSRVTDRLPNVGSRVMRLLFLINLICQTVIAVTGSVVRVTGSGLGCDAWPECHPGSMVPVAHPEMDAITQWIEFGNRLLSVGIGAVALLCLLGALGLRPRRPRVVRLAAITLAGTLLQALIGGITVWMDLTWWTVATHLLVSMCLVWTAVIMLRSANEGDREPRRLVPAAIQHLAGVATGVLAALIIMGTLVTAAGPHAGDPNTPRLDLPIDVLAQVHAELLFLFLGMLIALAFIFRAVEAPARAWRGYWWLLGVVLAQGAIGMVQYWTGVPEVLVTLHVLGAALVVVACAWLWTTLRDRGPAPAAFDAARPNRKPTGRRGEFASTG
ncbi:cytochrome c oxidase assembly protein subunit 15 [Actinoalloteichus hoggarensis]|uniref:COX15/CtaA family protein n=1 Tax=Actinoalloteichus hoggarensis TaxID=1470176 RepID=UPI00183E071F|nr:COX15/CtaA family protein [Actinoalloteichus hoggarensis]MBB5919292.1 cytochrome c oxidase assembly protein subunit 15 [Actinoalloteichus hoggarensis]